MSRRHKIWLLGAAAMLLFAACGPAPAADETNKEVTALAATISAMQTQDAQVPVTGATPGPTPQNPLVIKSTLCWLGPGPAYEVVSALKIGTRVTLLGRGSISGWWVVRNPIYRDPCWVEASAIRIEPGFSLANLQTFFPPPTATPTPTATPDFTPTASPTP